MEFPGPDRQHVALPDLRRGHAADYLSTLFLLDRPLSQGTEVGSSCSARGADAA